MVVEKAGSSEFVPSEPSSIQGPFQLTRLSAGECGKVERWNSSFLANMLHAESRKGAFTSPASFHPSLRHCAPQLRIAHQRAPTRAGEQDLARSALFYSELKSAQFSNVSFATDPLPAPAYYAVSWRRFLTRVSGTVHSP